MKYCPSLYNADALRNWNCQMEIQKGQKKGWVLARPLGFWGLCLTYRLKLAWNVFTGKYDALEWTEQ